MKKPGAVPAEAAPDEEEAKATFFPSVSFSGFPEGKETKFDIGVESVPVPVSYIEKMRAKGFVGANPAEPNEGKG